MRLAAILLGMLALGVNVLAGGRWRVIEDKMTGLQTAVLESPDNKRLVSIPLEHREGYEPVSLDDLPPSVRDSARRQGRKYVRYSLNSLSATPIQNGRGLVLQEQTIVMSPRQEGDQHRLENGDASLPSDNSVWVRFFDDQGETVWSKKFGPMRDVSIE